MGFDEKETARKEHKLHNETEGSSPGCVAQLTQADDTLHDALLLADRLLPTKATPSSEEEGKATLHNTSWW